MFGVGVLRVDGGRIAEMVAFHDATLFPAFGLPKTLRADPADPAGSADEG